MPEADAARRHWIVVASAAGGIGVAATAVPFVASMAPSERALALGAPVEVDIANIRPGELSSVAWRGKPVWVLHRTPAMLKALGGHDGLLADPRSTPCHGSKFDLAGRVFKSVPAPSNLEVPPYRYVDPSHLLVGVDPVA